MTTIKSIQSRAAEMSDERDAEVLPQTEPVDDTPGGTQRVAD